MTTLNQPITVRPLTTAIGAEIFGVDLSRLDDETFDFIRRTYNERGVIFFRDQELDAEQFLALGRRFGPLTQSKIARLLEGTPDLDLIRKEEDATRNYGNQWHTDQAYREVPVMGTMLLARQVPAAGGDTMFISMAAAFDALSDGLKQTLRGLRAIHSTVNSQRQAERRVELGLGPPDEAIHPVVGRHPVTDREVLYVNPHYALRFEGWTVDESRPLLQYLYAHAQRPEFQCRFRWEVGSLAFWDNRQCLHYAVNDYPGGERMHHRLMVEGPFLR
jgi:taurine dioxygenase